MTLDLTLLDAARAATEPSPEEVDALLRAVRDPRPAPSRWAPALVLAGAVALVLLGLQLLPVYGDAPRGEVTLSSTPMRFGPSITVVGPGAVRVSRADADGTRLELVGGSVTASVDPDGRFRALTIGTPDGTLVSVQGTVFTVSWDGRNGAASVIRGHVTVRGPQTSAQLAAGEQISWNDGTTVGEGFSPDPIPALEEDGGAPDLPDRGDHPLDPPAPRVVSAPAVTPAPAAPLIEPTVSEPAVSEPAASGPAVSEPVAALEQPVALDLARARAFGRVQAALEDGRPVDAEYLAGLFLDRYTEGSLRSEAQVLQIEAVASRDPRAGLALADAWLTAHAVHAQRVDVLMLHATLARDRLEDCARALPSYAELVRTTASAAQARALAFQGLCAAEVGDVALARPALDAALTHPDLPRALAPRVRSARDRLREDTP